jgi:hypothetical protein
MSGLPPGPGWREALPGERGELTDAVSGVAYVRNRDAELTAVAELRRRLWANGYRPVAVRTGGKVPLAEAWPSRARQNPPADLAEPPTPDALNTGLLAGPLRIVDLDIDNETLAFHAVEAAVQIFGPAPMRGRPNSPRRAILLQAAEGEPPKRTLAGRLGKIEVLGRGQQLVAYGTHETGVELTWSPAGPDTVPLTALPVAAEAQIDAFLTRCAALINAKPPILGKSDRAQPGASAGNGEHRPGEAPEADDPLRLAAALADIPNDGPADWEWWNKVGMAVWRATGGSSLGFEAFAVWSARHLAYDAAATRTRWAHYATSPPNEIGAGTIFYMAAEARARAQHAGTSSATEGFDPWEPPAGEPPPEPESEAPEPDKEAWPEPMELAAFRGLFGEAIAELAPHTEADINGLLLNLLTRFGNKIGRGPHYFVEGAKHTTNLFVLLCGATSRARKYTSARRIEALFAVDPLDQWLTTRCRYGGLSSGEGLIYAVRDARWERDKKGQLELADAGETDKRLLVIESEFASVMSVLKREGSTLSSVLRNAWDRGDLGTATRNNPLRASGALISVIGHCTIEELRNDIDQVALVNGFLNRFLIGAVRRARLLPFGGRAGHATLQRIGAQLDQAIVAARQLDQVPFTQAAADRWSAEYGELTADRPGILGGITARAEAQTVRLALLYALADQSPVIELVHLEAAQAVWRFCAASARLIFGDFIGDAVADSILVFLRGAGAAGMTRTELHAALNRNYSAARLQLALTALLKQGRVRRELRSNPRRPGPPAETWFWIAPVPYETKNY